MFINSASPAPAGTLLKLECDIDASSEQKIRGVARVVWLRREPSEHGPSGMGVKFVKLEPGSRELIEQIVARLAEAGVEARSVSAAPEHRLAAAAGGVATTASLSPEPAPSPVRLVPSTPPSEPQEASKAEAPAPREGAEVAASRVQPAQKSVEEAQPRAVAAAPAAREAVDDTRSSIGSTGSSRPPAKQSRISWKIWVAGIVLVLIVIALADRRGGGAKKAEVTPEPAAPVAAPAASPEPTPPAQPPAATAVAAQPKAAEPPSQPKAAEPSTPAAAEAKPKTLPAADAKPTAAAAALVPASATEPLFPSVPGQPDYVVEFVSQPNAATITVDEKATLVTPATINLGGMPDRIKVTAKKPGFKSSSIWMKRDGFELKSGVLKRRAYVTLREEPAAPAAK
jgi:hypothetical protein